MAAKMRNPTSGENGFIELFVELGDGSSVVLVPGCRTYAAEPDSEADSPEFHKAPGGGWNIAAC